jgi:hypothetical protein
MTGQDAVRSAGEFNARVGVTGVVMTKVDGDARGGAALSVVSVVPFPPSSYRSIEKPAMDAARQGLSIGFGRALHAQVRSLVLSTRTSIGRGAYAIAERSAASLRTGLSLFVATQRTPR